MSEPFQETAFRRGTILIDQGRYKEAVQAFKDQLSQAPTNDYLLYFLAVAQYHLDDQRKQSLQTIDEALKHENQEPAYYQLKSLILSGLKKHKLALDTVDEALRLNPQYPDAHAAKAYIFSMLEKWNDAEKSARDALSFDADNRFAGNVLANALRMQNKLDESVHLASDLLAKDPENSLSHSNAGWVYLNRRDYRKAQIHFKEALRLDPNFEPARSGMLEVFKAKSPLYRLYLEYGLFMSRQTKGARIWILMGIYIAYRSALKGFLAILNGPWAVVGYLGLIALYGFFFWTWLSRGIGNLLILCDPFARYSLKKTEKLDGIFTGGGFFAGISFILIGIAFKALVMTTIGIALIMATIPFSSTFTNDHKAGRIVYGAIGIFILSVGMIRGAESFFYGKEMSALLETASGLSLILFIASSWLGAFGFLKDY